MGEQGIDSSFIGLNNYFTLRLNYDANDLHIFLFYLTFLRV